LPFSTFSASPRYCAGLFHALSEAAEDGHCYLPQPELIESVIKLLTTDNHEPSEQAITQTIADMALKDELIRERDADILLCYKPTYYHTEQNLAELQQFAIKSSTKIAI
jgi:exodeoxyribonuclease V alpha subunit